MNLIHQTGAEMAMTDKIFTTRDREQTKKDAIEVWTPEDAFCGIIYPKFPIGPWNKIYKASLLKEHHIDFRAKKLFDISMNTTSLESSLPVVHTISTLRSTTVFRN